MRYGMILKGYLFSKYRYLVPGRVPGWWYFVVHMCIYIIHVMCVISYDAFVVYPNIIRLLRGQAKGKEGEMLESGGGGESGNWQQQRQRQAAETICNVLLNIIHTSSTQEV